MLRQPLFFYDESSSAGAGSAGASSSTNYQALYENLKKDLETKYISMERYSGLQSVLSKEQERAQKAEGKITELSGQLGDLTTAKSTLDGQLAALQASVQELTTYKTNTEGVLSAKDKKIKRFEVLAEKFPDLIVFEGKKLLPDAEPDQLETVFTNFKSTLASITADAGKKYVQGSAPESTGASTDKLPDEKSAQIVSKRKELKQLAIQGKQKEFDALELEIKALEKS